MMPAFISSSSRLCFLAGGSAGFETKHSEKVSVLSITAPKNEKDDVKARKIGEMMR